MYTIEKIGNLGGEFFLLSSESKTALIDSGFPCRANYLIKDISDRLKGRKLDYIILTHSHYDHAGGSPYFKRAFPGSKVVSGKYAAYVFTRPGAVKLIKEMSDFAAKLYDITEYEDLTGEIRADIEVEDGDTIDMGEFTLRAVPSPGHTKCSFSYYSPEAKLLIASETLGVLAGDTITPCCLVSYDDTIESIKRASKLGAEAILFSHGELLSGKEACDKFFADSLNAHEDARKMLRDASAEGKSKDELVAILKEHFYTEETKKIQPEKAFYLNAGYIINCMLKEN